MVRRGLIEFSKYLEDRSEFNFSNYKLDDCSNKNIIFVFKDNDGIEYWKINKDLIFQKDVMLYDIDDIAICNESHPLNEKGYVIFAFNSDSDCAKYYIVLSLIYSKNKFSFDEIFLQNTFDNLSTAQQNSYYDSLDFCSEFELENRNIEIKFRTCSHELGDFLANCYDHFYDKIIKFSKITNWDECFAEVDLMRKIIDKKYKKIASDIKRRQTLYKSRGYEFITGDIAYDTLKNPKTHSLLALDTHYWTCVKYINSVEGCNIDNFLHCFLEDGIIIKLPQYSDEEFRDFISQTNWAVRKIRKTNQKISTK
jgi:hypothetical protein